MPDVHHLRPADDAPIYSAEAEQAVLGAVLLDPSLIGRVVRGGGEDLFADPSHAAIFNAAAARDRAGELVSPVTVADALRGNEAVSGIADGKYIVRLAGAGAPSAAVPGYIDMLSDLRRKRELMSATSAAQAAITSGDQCADRIAAQLEAALIASEPAGGDGPVSMLKATTQAMEQIRAAYSGDGDMAVQTGFHRLDAILGGLYPGDLVYLGGRPSMGKTALALSVSLNIARAGKGVVIASLEMTPEAMAMRALSEGASNLGNAIPYTSMRRGDMHETQVDTLRRAAGAVSQLPITFLPRQYNDIGSLTAGCKQVARAQGNDLGMIVVDYLQLLRTSNRGSRNDQITELSGALKALAMQTGVPVLALSQLSRAVEQRDDKRPHLSDLRDSGSIEQDADTVMFCYRDEYYLEREKPTEADEDKLAKWQAAMDAARHRLDVIVAKQRQGAIGTARVRCNPASNIVWED